MLRNNGLQGTSPGLTAWADVGNATISVDSDNPLTSAIPHTLRLNVPNGATGQVGFTNEGYWGIPVDGSTFQNYFWMKGEFSNNVTVRLIGNNTGTEYASTSFAVSSKADEFTYVNVSFPTTKAPDGSVLYELTVDGESIAGNSLYFGLVQLFQETYHSRLVILFVISVRDSNSYRYNGLKPQLANTLETVKGSFLRFPGGNNL